MVFTTNYIAISKGCGVMAFIEKLYYFSGEHKEIFIHFATEEDLTKKNVTKGNNFHRRRKMILSMGAGLVDLCHSL